MIMKRWPIPLLFVFLCGCASATVGGHPSYPLDHSYASNRLLDCRSVAEARRLYPADASIRESDVRLMNAPAGDGPRMVEATLSTSRIGGDRGAPTVTRDHVTCWFEEERLVALHLNGRDVLAGADDRRLVFFDWNEHRIRADGFRVIEAVAGAVRDGSHDVVIAIGHTDSSGSPAYNMGLSQRRAMAVKAALQSMGVPASAIRTEWKGETQPLAPTPPGAREARNRRVEILLAP